MDEPSRDKIVKLDAWKIERRSALPPSIDTNPLAEIFPLEDSDAIDRSRQRIFFPNAWKDLARNIIESYRADPQNLVRGKPVGFTQLRDRIMADFDEFHPKTNRRSRDARLNRQDLQNWVLYSKYPTDGKFWFIDSFVRKIQMTAWYDGLIEQINAQNMLEHQRVLAHIYQQSSSHEGAKIASACRPLHGKLFVSRVADDEDYPLRLAGASLSEARNFRQIAIFVKLTGESVFPVTIIYTDTPFQAENNPAQSRTNRILFGYIIPNHVQAGSYGCGILLTYTKNEAGRSDGELRNTCSSVVMDPHERRIYLTRSASADDPSGWMSETRWKRKESKFSPLSSSDHDCFSDYTTELKYYREICEENRDYYANLTDRYLVW